jgi:RHS repeat-associated protein
MGNFCRLGIRNPRQHAGCGKRVTFTDTDEITVTARSGERWVFDTDTKFLKMRVDASGNETDFEWKTEEFEFWDTDYVVYCPTKITYPGGRELDFTYNTAAGKRHLVSKVEGPGDIEVDYTYTDGLLTGIGKTGGLQLTYNYHTSRHADDASWVIGWLTGITYANGGEVEITYNGQFGVPGKLKVTRVTGPLGYEDEYEITKTEVTVVDDATITDYYVNNLNQHRRLGSREVDFAQAKPARMRGRDERERASQYVQVDLNTAFTYDTDGNLTADGTWTYCYDQEGRLISATDGTTTASYKYDAIGRRIEKNVGGTITKYVYSGQDLIEERDSTDTVTAKCIYAGGIDNPVAVIKSTGTFYYQQDALGNVTALTDSTGSIVESYTYDAFGKPTIKDGSGSTISTPMQPFLFTGREYDPETTLYHYRTRAYSPELGRFLQPDSIGFRGGDLNLYRYVSNNPVNRSDAFGMCCEGQKLALDIANEYLDSSLDALTGATRAVISAEKALAMAVGAHLVAVGVATRACVAVATGVGAAACAIAISAVGIATYLVIEKGKALNRATMEQEARRASVQNAAARVAQAKAALRQCEQQNAGIPPGCPCKY